MASHVCKDGKESAKFTWWEHDRHGIALCKVCEDCKAHKLAKYRPEILPGYEEPAWMDDWRRSEDYDYSDVYDF